MFRRWRFAAAAIVLLAACSEPAAPPADDAIVGSDGENLLTLTRGAVVVHRTGEAGLHASAVQAIDSDPLSFWATPPGDLDETMTVALGGDAEIRRIGLSSGPRAPRHPARSVRFEASLDGASFSPLGTVTLDEPGEAWRDVAPARARFLRIATVPEGTPPWVQVPTLLASGSLRPAPRASIAGGWTINGVDAWFESRGDAVRGVTRETPPRLLEGGWEGPIVRLAWSRANEHGVVALAVDPSGQRMNGILWYLWPHRPFFGTTWFGRRNDAARPPSGGEPPLSVFLRSDGRYPLYGLSFVGEQLTAHSSRAVEELASIIGRSEPGRFRLVAHYVDTGSAESDRRLAAARLDALRAALRGAGVDPSRAEFAAAGRAAAESANDRPWTPLQVAVNNRVDLEIVSRGPTRR